MQLKGVPNAAAEALPWGVQLKPERESVIRELIDSPHMGRLLQDPYANCERLSCLSMLGLLSASIWAQRCLLRACHSRQMSRYLCSATVAALSLARHLGKCRCHAISAHDDPGTPPPSPRCACYSLLWQPEILAIFRSLKVPGSCQHLMLLTNCSSVGGLFAAQRT